VVDGVMEAPCAHEGPLAEWPEHPIRSRMRVHPEGKPARTEFTPLAAREGRTLILCRPVTGRKHQIRAHLADLGLPITGDKVYGHEGRYYLKRLDAELTAEDVEALGAPHQLLHAASLTITSAGGAGADEITGRNAGGSSPSPGVPPAAGIAGFDAALPQGFARYFPEVTPEWLRDRFERYFIV
jgi:hypothetical protein